MINFAALLVLLYAINMTYLVNNYNFRRRPSPESELLIRTSARSTRGPVISSGLREAKPSSSFGNYGFYHR